MYSSKQESALLDTRQLTYVRLLCLTCGLGGLQTVWAMIISHGSPYLTSLGLSRSTTALVWASSPACGFLQPVIGIMSDRCTLSWGRRRPFVLAGAVSSMACILALAWVEALFGPDLHLAQIMAVLTVVLLNISMTPLAFGLRSLITDLAVAEAQSQVTAWASYSAFAANTLSLWEGSLDLPKVLGVASLTQFQALSIIACVSLTTTTTVCLWTASEQNPKLDVTLAKYKTMGPREVLHSIRQAYRHTPPRIRRVFAIQVFSWTAWFPFLFYMTSYVNTRYALSQLRTFHGWTDINKLLTTHGTQIGSTALLMWTTVSFATTLVLTHSIRRPRRRYSAAPRPGDADLSMATAWTCSHVIFATCMVLTLVVKSWEGTVVLVSLVGCSWAATQWIPHAIIGAEISPKHDMDDALLQHRGTILGLHNLAISAPQIVAASASSGIMWLMTAAGSVEPAVWPLRVAALPAMIAATLACGLDA